MNVSHSHTAACDWTVPKFTPESIKRALNVMRAAPPTVPLVDSLANSPDQSRSHSASFDSPFGKQVGLPSFLSAAHSLSWPGYLAEAGFLTSPHDVPFEVSASRRHNSYRGPEIVLSRELISRFRRPGPALAGWNSRCCMFPRPPLCPDGLAITSPCL